MTASEKEAVKLKKNQNCARYFHYFNDSQLDSNTNETFRTKEHLNDHLLQNKASMLFP